MGEATLSIEGTYMLLPNLGKIPYIKTYLGYIGRILDAISYFSLAFAG